METENQTEVLSSVQEFWDEISKLGIRLTQTWTLYQIAIIIGLALLAIIIARILRPRIAQWLESSNGLSQGAIRVLIDVEKRVPLAFYVPLAYSAVAIMRLMTWPSRSFFVKLSAELALIWLVISIITAFIKNRTLRALVTWIGWVVATLHLTGFLIPTQNLLDSAAIELGDTRLSVLMVLIALFSLVALFIMASLISKAGSKRIHKIQDMSPSIKVLLTKTLQIGLYTTAFLLGLKAVGFDLTSLAVLSGAIGLGIGFGLQKIVSNLISGIIILLDKSIKPGDVISLQGTFGWITQLGARYASVTTRDGREHLIPNEDFITNQVINWSHSSDFVRLDIFFGVDYKSNPHEVKRVASTAPLSVERVVSNPKPVCHVVNFGDSSIDFILRFWIRDPNKGLTNIRGNVYLALWDVLKENNIAIPYPRREITMVSNPDLEIETTRRFSDKPAKD